MVFAADVGTAFVLKLGGLVPLECTVRQQLVRRASW
jgi:hypothetical protein